MQDNYTNHELEVEGSHELEMTRELLWESINDPDILAASIKGCEEVVRVSDTGYRATFVVGIGPFRKKFHASLEVVPLSPPAEYRLECHAEGRIAGSANGTAVVHLHDTGPECTRLDYSAGISVRGRIASLGTKLLGGAAERYMDNFFQRLIAAVEKQQQS